MQDTKSLSFGTNNGTYASSSAAALLSTVASTANDLSRIHAAITRHYSRESLGAAPASSTFILLSRNYGFSQIGKDVTWTKEYSINDPSVDPTGGIIYTGWGSTSNGNDTGGMIRKLSKTINDQLPIPMHTTYPILGWKEMVHDANQTSLGKRAVTVKATRPRINGENILLNPVWPGSLLFELVKYAKEECLKIYSDIPQRYQVLGWGHFLSSASASFDSKGSMSVSCEMSYIARRRAQTTNVTSDYTEG